VVFWLTVGGSVLFGFLVGRWWTLLLPPLVSVIVFSEEAEAGDNPFVGLVFLWGAFLTIGVVIGVILRKRVSTSSDHPSHPPDTPIE